MSRIHNQYRELESSYNYIDKTECLEKEIERFPSVYIEGAAGCGKTTMMRMFLEKHPEVDYTGAKLYEDKILPLDITGNTIYYLGPTPAKPGQVIGSAGPTTSSRMDKYTPLLLSKGLKGMIGKGKRSQAVIDAIVKEKAVYMAAVGGAGALLSKCIKESEVIAYDDLGTEAIRKMRVENLPVIVVIDSEGHNLYETAVADYLKEHN